VTGCIVGIKVRRFKIMGYLSSTKKQVSVAIAGAILMALRISLSAAATTSGAAPLYEKVDRYETTIATNNDPADIYFPIPSDIKTQTDTFPIALLLPGALVDKSYYSNFARIVASYGFVVVVPNHRRSVPALGVKRLLAETSQVNHVLNYMVKENSNPTSPIAGMLDTKKLVLLGHSHGGAVGMTAIENSCVSPFCEGNFTRPDALIGGAFYGTHRKDLKTGKFSATKNAGIPIALVEGSRDGVATQDEVQGTYELIQDRPKMLITVNGANHFSITDVNHPAGAKPDSSNPTLDQPVATETIARWSALFLRAYALHDASALDYLKNTDDSRDENVKVMSQAQPVSESLLILSVLIFSACNISLIKF
jgi:predicted dienelactone hydrolase